VTRCLPVILLATLAIASAACGRDASDDASSSPASLAHDYVEAINDKNGEEVCALLTEDAAAELTFYERDFPCARAVAGLIGYVEDSGNPAFLGYERIDARPSSERQGYTTVRLVLEARFHTDSEGGYFEVCRFEDTVWFALEGDTWRIATPSLALYAAFGAVEFPVETLAPPGVGSNGEDGTHLSRLELFSCRRDVGVQPAPSAGEKWNAASLAHHLASDEDHFVDVRCIEAADHEGWDYVCTYYDPTLGKRMKVGQAVDAGGMALVGSGSVPEDSSLPPRS
jgi:hypothetical protein